jgi:hypothetical protein
VNVLFTLAVIGAIAAWAMVVIRRLAALRTQVTLAWKRLEADLANEAIKTVYNKHVVIYNSALEAFPANLLAPIANFKPAKQYS